MCSHIRGRLLDTCGHCTSQPQCCTHGDLFCCASHSAGHLKRSFNDTRRHEKAYSVQEHIFRKHFSIKNTRDTVFRNTYSECIQHPKNLDIIQHDIVTEFLMLWSHSIQVYSDNKQLQPPRQYFKYMLAFLTSNLPGNIFSTKKRLFMNTNNPVTICQLFSLAALQFCDIKYNVKCRQP